MFSTDALDREKFALEKQKARDLRVMEDLAKKLNHAKKALHTKRSTMSNYSTTFLVGGEVKLVGDKASPAGKAAALLAKAKKKPKRAPLHAPGNSARFGRKDAVLGTKKIISKHMTQLGNQAAVMKKKLNTAQHENRLTREKINGLRKEQLVYDRLFDKMQGELEEEKAKIDSTKAKIEAAYSDRNQIRKEMQSIMDRMQELQLEAKLEWQVQDKALADSDNLMRNPLAARGSDEGAGNLSPEQEQELKRQQQTALWQIAKDKTIYEKLQGRHKTFARAVEDIKDGTGYDDLADLVAQLKSYEEEKFAKVEAINHVMQDIEEKESKIQNMRAEYDSRESMNDSLTDTKRGTLTAIADEETGVSLALEEQQNAIRTLLEELGALFVPIEDLFGSIDCKDMFGEGGVMKAPSMDLDAFEREQEQAAAGADGAHVESKGDEGKEDDDTPTPTTPGKTPSGAMKMYLQSPAIRETVHGGISVANLGEFVSIMEQRASEIIQKYAVVMKRYGGTQAAAAAMAQLAGEDAGREASRSSRVGFRGDLMVGPQLGTGALRHTLTQSALLAATIDIDTIQDDEPDSARPMDLEELRASAMRALKSESLAAAKKASSAAASYLVTQQDRRRKRLSSRH